jgi:glyoxylase-like metal-dependent hydrolase (beta-lactamase superfamily II)
MDNSPQVRKFETSSGAQIYQLPLEAFPNLWTYAYLVFAGELRVLIDTGSGFWNSNEHLRHGIDKVAEQLENYPFSLADLTHIFITHGHIDHFGGLNFIQPQTKAQLGIHELDLRNLTQYEERLVVVSHNLDRFLSEAGVSDTNRVNLLTMYRFTKELFRSVPVDFTYQESGMRVGPFEFFHVPGHSAGHVVIRLDEVLFSGDHVLEEISPHQAPERLTLSTGLEHYLNSLDTLDRWAGSVKLTLGGHNEPVQDLSKRLGEIREVHANRLEQVKEFMKDPHTISDLSHHLFHKVQGYNILLALEEAGAHLEYLYQRGWLTIVNLEEVEQSNGPVALRYRLNERDGKPLKSAEKQIFQA